MTTLARSAPDGLGDPDVPRSLSVTSPVWLVLLYLLVLFLMPSKYVLAPPLAFTPIGLMGLVMFGVWAVLHVNGFLKQPATSVHLALLFVAVATFASYAAAAARPTEAEEMNGADRAVVTLLATAGVVLLTAEVLQTDSSVRRVVRWMGTLLGVVSALALLQAALGYDPLSGISIPGFQLSYDWLTDTRSGFVRANGTAVHPIEYGAVVAAGLPILLHLALHSERRRRLWLAVSVMAAATLVLTVSRSAVIGLLVGLLVLLPTWTRAVRRICYLVMLVGAVTIRLLFPGVIGTIVSAFTFFSQDPSTQGRSRDYAEIIDYVQHAPVVGLGEGTFSPTLYRILDNQYLLTLVMQGFVGLTALLVLLGSGVWLAISNRRRLTDPQARSLQRSLLASLLVTATSFALYDGLSFPQATGTFLIVLGLIAASRRVYAGRPAPVRAWPRTGPRLLLSALGGVLVAAAVAFLVQPGGQYIATWSYHLRPTDLKHGLFAAEPNVDTMTGVLAGYLRSEQARIAVRAAGGKADYAVAQGRGSLMPGTEYPGTGNVLRIQVTSDDPATADSTVRVVSELARENLQVVQEQSGAPRGSSVIMDPVATSDASWYAGRRSRLAAALLLTSMSASWLAFLILPRLNARWRRWREVHHATG